MTRIPRGLSKQTHELMQPKLRCLVCGEKITDPLDHFNREHPDRVIQYEEYNPKTRRYEEA